MANIIGPAAVVDQQFTYIRDMLLYLDNAKQTGLREQIGIVIRGLGDLDSMHNCDPATAIGTSEHALINDTLTKVCLYLGMWYEVEDSEALSLFFFKMQTMPKPWTNSVVKQAFPSAANRANSRKIKDFDLGSLVGGHTSNPIVRPNVLKPLLTLDGLEHFSKELSILEALLPLYLENI
jgi:hypothetical protein